MIDRSAALAPLPAPEQLQLGPQRAVVPETVDAAINLRRLENETAPLAEADDFFHQDGIFFGSGFAHGVKI
mgnify:CR=1 FL=1